MDKLTILMCKPIISPGSYYLFKQHELRFYTTTRDLQSPFRFCAFYYDTILIAVAEQQLARIN
jgi:hypothetical protein